MVAKSPSAAATTFIRDEIPVPSGYHAVIVSGEIHTTHPADAGCRAHRTNNNEAGIWYMKLEKVIVGFFVILALALNVVFVIGDISNPAHHNVWILTLAILANLIAAGLILGDRTQLGAILLATSLVANLLLISARLIWVVNADAGDQGLGAEQMVLIVSLAFGALMANLISVFTMAVDTIISRR